MGLSPIIINLLIVLTIGIKDGFATGIKGLECQFTDGLCDWLNDTNSWLLGDYNDVSFGKPIEASLSGGYVYVGEDNVNHFHQLVSSIIEEDVGPFCFSFGYYMFGSSVGQLSLRLIDDNGSKSQWIEVDDDVWKRQGSQFDDWSIGKYHFDPKKKVKVRIAFVATTPNIAIGPIKVTPGSCDYEDFCDFEDLSSCFWTIEPDYRSNFAWYISDGKSRDSVKVVDTTTLTDSGKYLRTPNDGQKDSKSILATNVKMSSNNAKCLTFNLAKPHQDSDLVEVSISRGNQSDTELIWTSSSIKAESKWLPIEIDLKDEPDNFDILITAHKQSDGVLTQIAIDDLRVSPSPCKSTIDCTFDNINCHMNIMSGPLLVGFGRLSNSQALNYSITSADQDNFFLYTDTPVEDKSVNYKFVSQIVPKTNVACLSLRYLIDSIDSKAIANYLFEINVLTAEGSSRIKYEPAVIFGQWSQVEYTVSDPYQIEFSLIAESKLFAGFDDIKLVDGVCDPQIKPDEPNIYLRENFNDKTNWVIWKTAEIKKYSNTLKDNYRGYPRADPFGDISGNYISLYGDIVGVKQAKIESKQLESGSYCFSIWSWCTSLSNSRIFISLIDSSSGKWTPILDRSCDYPNHWKILQASYHSNNNYSINIIAESSEGLVALEEMTIFKGPCYQDHVIDETCTFDDGTDCGVDVVTSPFYNWRIEKGSSLSTPIVDKSTNTLNGKSLILDLNPTSKVNSTSYFYLANLRKEDSYCISFAYMIKGEHSLSIWKTEREEIDLLADPLVIYDGSFGPNWFQVLFQVNSVNLESDIVFGGSYSVGSSGLIAIDDLKVSQGECISSGVHNFDNLFHWTNLDLGTTLNVEGLDIGYKVANIILTSTAENAKTLGYPRKDHTLGTSDGVYGFLSSMEDHRTIMASPLIYLGTNEPTLCLKFAYAGEENNIEILVEQQEDKAYIFKTLDAKEMRTWTEASLTIQLRPSPSRMARVYIVSSSKGLLALDDLSIQVGSCSTGDTFFTCSDATKIHGYYQCDYKKDCPKGEDEINCGGCEFDSDACGYGSINAFAANWKVRNNYIELEQNRLTFGIEATSSIASPPIQETSSSCKINFNYVKHSADLLVVYLSMNSKEIQIWDSSIAIEHSGWNQVTIELGRIRNEFQLVFKGTTSYRVFEYQPFSIDYVRFVDCDFKSTDLEDPKIFVCSDGQRLLSSSVCDSTLDCRSGEDEDNCNNQVYSFENGILSPWFNGISPDSKNLWSVSSGNGLVSNKPTLDHSRRLPDGSFAYVTAIAISLGATEPFIGPQLNSTENCIITFYYYLSSSLFQLKVFLANSENEVYLQTISQPSDFGFKKISIPLESKIIEPPFQVKFIGDSKYPTSYSYIALDDITFNEGCYGIKPVEPSPGPKPEPEPEKYCKGNEFHCKIDGKCIPIESSCNYISDCSDGEDEKYCGSCTFDNNNLCNWINEGSNQWIPMNLSTAQQEGFSNEIKAPNNLLVATGSSLAGSAAIRSPLLGKTSSICVFKFKYHLSGESKLTLRIRQENSAVSKVIEELKHHSSSDSNEWLEGLIELPSLTFGHYLQFVLDTPPSDTFLTSSGLSDFEMSHCDPGKVNLDSFNCLFDENSCGWTDSGSKGLSWSLTTNTSHQDDHKFGYGSYSNKDHPNFLNLDISNDLTTRSMQTLTSPWQYATDIFCFSFDYRLLAFDETKFMLIINDGSILRTLYMKNGEPNYGWNHGSVTIKGVSEFRLIFQIELSANSEDTVVSIDNLALSTGSCKEHQSSCDFSTGTCDWINDGWSIVEKQQVPSADGLNREYYLRNYGSRSSSLVLKANNDEAKDKCLSFWYLHTFNLTSDLLVSSMEKEEISASEIVPNHEMANIWSYYRTSVMTGGDYGVEIQAGPLESSFDTTAIDDVTIYNEPCKPPGNCDFEYDSCGWQSKNVIKWRRNLGVTPSTDNSLADKMNFDIRKWFIFVRAADLINGQISTLESIRLTFTSPYCISFNYLFTSGTLSDTKISVKILDTLTDKTNELFILPDHGTNEWQTAEKTIRQINPFKVQIIASSKENQSGDIAIDDIKFTQGKCSSDVETTTPPPAPTTKPSTTRQESTTRTIESTTINEPTIKPSTESTNHSENRSASVLTANTIMYIIKQNSHIIIGTVVAAIMLLFPMVFVARSLMRTKKTYQPNESISASNKVYDIILGNTKSLDQIYEEVDSSGSPVQFEMRNIS